MKAQRRHELKTNSLVSTLQNFPEAIKQYQSQIALVLILIALVIVMVRYRISNAEARRMAAQQGLSVATDELNRLKTMAFEPGTDGTSYMKQREEFYFDGLQQVEDAFEKAPNSQPGMKAQALLTRGDLNFEMANDPALPGSATQPTLRPAEPEETLLSNAYDAYTQVLRDYPNEKFAVTAAHFGLAAVAEDRAGKDSSQWAIAKAQYQAIIDSDADSSFKTNAQYRLALLPKLAQPRAVGFVAPETPPAAPLGTTLDSATPAAPLGPTLHSAPWVAPVPATRK